jgi:proteasome lid subunit RPN8/RPN11
LARGQTFSGTELVVVRIPQDVRDAIFRHAAAHYPEECCGILLGDPAERRVVMAFAAGNTAEERRRRYVIEPLDIVRADKLGREKGLEIIGFYHSHPDHPAAPSRTDHELAWPDYMYVIAGVTAGAPGELRAWQLVEAGAPMEEVRVR